MLVRATTPTTPRSNLAVPGKISTGRMTAGTGLMEPICLLD